jgi:hypothetical protein
MLQIGQPARPQGTTDGVQQETVRSERLLGMRHQGLEQGHQFVPLCHLALMLHVRRRVLTTKS